MELLRLGFRGLSPRGRNASWTQNAGSISTAGARAPGTVSLLSAAFQKCLRASGGCDRRDAVSSVTTIWPDMQATLRPCLPWSRSPDSTKNFWNAALGYRRLDVGLREVVPDEQEGDRASGGKGVGEAITEVETRRMVALPVGAVGVTRQGCLLRVDGDDLDSVRREESIEFMSAAIMLASRSRRRGCAR